jgi:hypothetical protein
MYQDKILNKLQVCYNSSEEKVMTVDLELKPEVEAALRKKAKAGGFEVKVYLEKLVEKDVERPKTLDEILAPFRREVEESGISDEELDALVEEAREEIYQENLAKQRERN